MADPISIALAVAEGIGGLVKLVELLQRAQAGEEITDAELNALKLETNTAVKRLSDAAKYDTEN